MDTMIAMRVNGLVSQGNQILQGLSKELGQLDAPEAVVAKSLLVEGAGAFAAGLFGTQKAMGIGKKATRAYLAGTIRENRRAIMTKYEGVSAGWENSVVQFLQQVSTSAPQPAAPGNSDRLIKRVRQADRYKKTQTRVKHILTELEAMRNEGLTLNSSLPQALPKPRHMETSSDASNLLKHLEGTLRRFIQRELSKADKNWWQRVPPGVRRDAERRLSRCETVYPWYTPTSKELIDYLDFSDYQQIILNQHNWQEVFVKFFKRTSFVEVWLSELELLRNDIAHCRPIPPDAMDEFRIISKKLLSCIDSK